MKKTTDPKDMQRQACPLCDAKDGITGSLRNQAFEYGVGNDRVQLSATVMVFHCDACDSSFTDESAELVRHDAVCRYRGLLTPSEVRNLRLSNNLARRDFAALTGIGEASLARWETGVTLQSVGYDNLLRLIRDDPSILRRIESYRAPAHALPEPPSRKFPALKDIGEYRTQQAEFKLRPAIAS